MSHFKRLLILSRNIGILVVCKPFVDAFLISVQFFILYFKYIVAIYSRAGTINRLIDYRNRLCCKCR